METIRKNLLFAIPIIILIIAVYSFFFSRSLFYEAINNEFEQISEEIRIVLQERLQSNIGLMLATEGLFLASEEVERSEYNDFFKNFSDEGFEENFPGVNSVSFIRNVPKAELEEYLDRIRAESVDYPYLEDFDISPQIERAKYSVVEYIFPPENQDILGFDMNSSAERRRGLDRARDTSEVSLTGPIVLVRNNGNQELATLMSAPLYRKNSDISNVASRRANIVGYIQATMFYEDLFSDALFDFAENTGISYRIVDVTPDEERVVVAQNISDIKGPFLGINFEKTLEIANRKFIFEVSPTDGVNFAGFYKAVPWTVSIAGVLTSLLTFVLIWLYRDDKKIVQDLKKKLDEEGRKRSEMELKISEQENIEKEVELLRKEVDSKNKDIADLTKILAKREARMKNLKTEDNS